MDLAEHQERGLPDVDFKNPWPRIAVDGPDPTSAPFEQLEASGIHLEQGQHRVTPGARSCLGERFVAVARPKSSSPRGARGIIFASHWRERYGCGSVAVPLAGHGSVVGLVDRNRDHDLMSAGVVRELGATGPLGFGSQQAQLEALVTCRPGSLFQPDIEDKRAVILKAVHGQRVLVVGGGGSIGSITTRILTGYGPRALHVVDQSENYLAELVRDLRGRPEGIGDIDFRTIPIDYGGPIMERFLNDAEPYDTVLNFAALKHVRSEKDIYSVLQMLDTNVVRHIRFKEWLARNGHGRIYFAVSTDKAANPTSLMGASKRLMEDLVFGIAADHASSTTSVRFANVAFSNGSLLHGFRHRFEQRQPLAVPRETRRYFVSHQEAGELCILAAFAVPDGHVAFPKLHPRTQLQNLDEIAVRIVKAYGFAPEFFEDEEQARRQVEMLARSGYWPILLTPLDTSGEKPYEEFVGDGEVEIDVGLRMLAAVHHRPSRAHEEGIFDHLAALVTHADMTIGKVDIVSSIKQALINFRHVDTGRNLDQRF
jgi:nucleoside-diphosphate-sugar epimerase